MSLSQLTHVSYQTGVIARFVIPRVTWYYTIIPARLSLGGVYAGMYWGNMLTCLGLHGFILVGLVSFYVYWSDVEVAADACLVGLVLELLGVGLLTRYCLTTDCVFFLHLGSA